MSEREKKIGLVTVVSKKFFKDMEYDLSGLICYISVARQHTVAKSSSFVTK